MYNTLGFPNPSDFTAFIDGVRKAGADVLEVGLPPRYAKYDGPVIRRSHEIVAKFGDLSGNLGEVARRAEIPVVILTYLEDHIDHLDQFLDSLKKLNVEGVLFPDLLIDFTQQIDLVVSKVRAHGLKNVLFTSPSVPDSFKSVQERSQICFSTMESDQPLVFQYLLMWELSYVGLEIW